MIDADALSAAIASCSAMRASEIKAELNLRKVKYDDLFEKDELASRLARARIAGRADPDLLDTFNKASIESAFRSTDESDDAAEYERGVELAAEHMVAADGSLPGGMRPDQLAALAQDPEVMAMLRNPRMQEVLREVMSNGPDALQEKFKDDDEMRAMLKKAGALFGIQ